MQYQEIPPHPTLRPFVLNYWLFQGPKLAQHPQPIQHTAPPDGCVSLFLVYNKLASFRSCGLLGPSARLIHTQVYPDSLCLGIRAFPGMAAAVFGMEVKELQNAADGGQLLVRGLGLEEVLQELDLGFSDFGLLDQRLMKVLPLRPAAADAEVQKAVSAIMERGGRLSLAALKETAALSERQLQKRFLQKVGLSMKEFAGTCKLRATLIEAWVNHKDLFETLYERGYYDQAHFLHHLKKLSKSKPSAFKEHVAKIHHSGVKPFEELLPPKD